MEVGSGQEGALDIQGILELIPHRYPMLLVDRILFLDVEGKKCIGVKNVSVNEPFFQGHYPGLPIMPGVLVLECLAQVGAIFAANRPELRGLVPLMGTIEGAKFRRPVRPGDQIVAEVDLLWIRGGVGRMKGIARVEGETAAEMEMVFKLIPYPSSTSRTEQTKTEAG